MRMGWKRPFLFAQIQLRRGFEDIYRLKTVQGLGFYPLIQDCSLNPEMERVLVEGTVKEARAGTIRVLEASQRRDRVPEAKTLGMKGF